MSLKHSFRFLSFGLLAAVLAMGCNKAGSTATGRNTFGDASSGTGGTGFNPSASIDAATDALEGLTGLTAEQQPAVDAGIANLQDWGAAFDNIENGVGSIAEARAIANALAAAEAEAKAVAEQLRAAGFAALAEAFLELTRKRPVYRMIHKDKPEHFYTISLEEVVIAGVQSNMILEGVGFNVYKAAKESCNVVLYRCYYQPGDDHFTSTSSTCEGQEQYGKGVHGYICPAQQSYAFNALWRSYNSKVPDNFTTASKEEADYAATVGWVLLGKHGFVPN